MTKQSLKRETKMLRQNQRYIIVGIFSDIKEAWSVKQMIDILERVHGYENPGWMIRDAIQEGLLYVDNIDNNGVVFLALTDFGEETWWQIHG